MNSNTTPIQSIQVPLSLSNGPQIGTYKGSPIYDSITDNFGRVRFFGGVFTKQKIKPGSIIIAPGLIYEPE